MGHDGHERYRLDDASEPVEAHGPPDVGRGRLPAAVTHERVVHQGLSVDARPRELEAERAGHCRFRPAGVRRTVLRSVAADGAPGVARRGARRERRGGDEKERGKAQADRVTRSSSRAAAQPKAA